MNGLKEQFGTSIDFVDLNIDDSSLNDIRSQYGITGRSQYVLVDGNGEVIQRWFGYLDEDEVAQELQAYLDGRAIASKFDEVIKGIWM